MTDHEVPETVGRPPAMIRIACIVLMVRGSAPWPSACTPTVDPAGSRCNLSRERINSANTDKKPWNNVDTGGSKARDLSCPDAIRLIRQIKLSEKGTKTDSAPERDGGADPGDHRRPPRAGPGHQRVGGGAPP